MTDKEKTTKTNKRLDRLGLLLEPEDLQEDLLHVAVVLAQQLQVQSLVDESHGAEFPQLLRVTSLILLSL